VKSGRESPPSRAWSPLIAPGQRLPLAQRPDEALIWLYTRARLTDIFVRVIIPHSLVTNEIRNDHGGATTDALLTMDQNALAVGQRGIDPSAHRL